MRWTLTLTVLVGAAFGGGVWLSRTNDNFHDFFTEYVPFGEQAVLYFEEADFRKRLRERLESTLRNKPRDTGPQVKVPAQSGASWRVADSGKGAGRQSSAIGDEAPAAPKTEPKPAAAEKVVKESEGAKPVVVATEPPPAPTAPAKVKAASSAAAAASAAAAGNTVSSAPPTAPPSQPLPQPAQAAPEPKQQAATPTAFKPPEVDEPSRWPPVQPIDPLAVNDAAEPIVQEVVKMLNDIITVVNADNAQDRFTPTIAKAKDKVQQVGSKIRDMKERIEADAAARVKAQVEEFGRAADAVVSRVEAAMAAQESHWREELEAELARLTAVYDERVKTMTARERELADARLANALKEQAIALQRDFAAQVASAVESEREGRLARLDELSRAVAELDKLAAGWAEIIDANLRTQRLHVAVEAVKRAAQPPPDAVDPMAPPRAFVRELVALKETSDDDPVVAAAIASIHPSAYQRGLPSTAALIDRFRRVADEVRKAALLPNDAGVASHASGYVLSKVLFRKKGLAPGDDVESILTRAQTYLEEGDLDGAAREVNGLKGWAKTLSSDWLREVRKVLEVQQALDVSCSCLFFLYNKVVAASY